MNAENDPLVAPAPPTPPAAPQRSTVRKVLRFLLTVFIVSPALLLIGLWSALAIHFPSISHQSFRTTLACADRMAYDNGGIATQNSFAETRKKHYVNQYVEGKPDIVNFSELIRPHLVDR
jgi:hypothetical protein